MKTLFITALIVLTLGVYLFAHNIDFSANLVCDGRVHTDVPSVTDKNGNIFVAGGTKGGLLVTDDAFQNTYNGDGGWVGAGDMFLMKFSPGGELLYSTYIGGSLDEFYCHKIALDDLDNVYIGLTTSSPDLPTSKNAYQKSINKENDHYIIKFSNDCNYIASTYLGGSGSDHWTRLAVNHNVLYVIGATTSLDFPTTADAVQEEFNNWTNPDTTQQWMVKDITVTALSLDLETILHSTYLGGKNYDSANSLTFDKNNNIILAGSTMSNDFPTSEKCIDSSFDGDYDGFLTILSSDLSKMKYSTYIGGNSSDYVRSITMPDNKNIILVGKTQSLDFPVTPDAINMAHQGGRTDGFITKLNIRSNKLMYSSFIGGSNGDLIRCVEKAEKKKIIVVGRTSSRDLPITENAIQDSIAGGVDLFIMQLDKTLKNIEYSTYLGGSKHEYSPTAEMCENNKLVMSFISQSTDLPVSNKYAELDSTNMNVLLKIDLNKK